MKAISPGCNCDITTTGAIFGLRMIENAVICACIPNDLDGYDVVHAYVVCAQLTEVVSDVNLSGSMSIIDTEEPNDEIQNEINRLQEMREAVMQTLN